MRKQDLRFKFVIVISNSNHTCQIHESEPSTGLLVETLVDRHPISNVNYIHWFLFIFKIVIYSLTRYLVNVKIN